MAAVSRRRLTPWMIGAGDVTKLDERDLRLPPGAPGNAVPG